jgi:hypothetical protein
VFCGSLLQFDVSVTSLRAFLPKLWLHTAGLHRCR